MTPLKLLLCSLVLAAPATSAWADTFNFSFSGAQISGAGQFTATLLSSDPRIPNTGAMQNPVYQITGVSGTADGQAISGLVAAGSFYNNNLLNFPATYNGNSFFDQFGVSFRLLNSELVNLNSLGTEYAVLGASSKYQTNSPIQVTATPEPASIALLATGATGVLGCLRRRRAA